jgi:hypothetical protein
LQKPNRKKKRIPKNGNGNAQPNVCEAVRSLSFSFESLITPTPICMCSL